MELDPGEIPTFVRDYSHLDKLHKGLWKLTAPIQIAMTGTPVMNTPDERPRLPAPDRGCARGTGSPDAATQPRGPLDADPARAPLPRSLLAGASCRRTGRTPRP